MNVIGLTGTNAAGKGEVANYLKNQGYAYFSLSDAIRDELKKEDIEETRDNLIKKGTELRENGGPGVLGKLIKEKINQDPKNTIVDSIRNPKEVEELRRLNGFMLIAVDAPIELRFERAMSRGRVENASTLEEFKNIEEKENSDNPNAQQLTNTIKLADYKIINDSDLESLHKKIEELINKK